mgnify:CR=1 FL=1
MPNVTLWSEMKKIQNMFVNRELRAKSSMFYLFTNTFATINECSTQRVVRMKKSIIAKTNMDNGTHNASGKKLIE